MQTVHSASIRGVEGVVVDVEVDIVNQLPGMDTVGLPGNAVKEGKNRIRSAIRNSGFRFPDQRVVVNLAPARLKKTGTAFDLPIALGILACESSLVRGLKDVLVVGELGLDGAVRSVPGVLPMVLAARDAGFKQVLVPDACSNEAASVTGVRVFGVSTLRGALAFVQGALDLEPATPTEPDDTVAGDDFCDVVGLDSARRAAEIAAAGGHNLLMVGSPGTGKTLLARRLPSILPALSEDEAFEVTRIHSVAGLLKPGEGLRRRRPFRAPHHSCSAAGLIGGGTPSPRPGEVTLAHRGVLFLDEFPEFNRSSVEGLRQPMEDRRVVIVRSQESIEFPASFMLIAAMNPCPCGRLLLGVEHCECPEFRIAQYVNRLSGPLLDRIDLQVAVGQVPWEDMADKKYGEPSADIRSRVTEARERQRFRLLGTGIHTNAELNARLVDKWCQATMKAKHLLLSMEAHQNLSARTYHRILKVARTCADLDGQPKILERHVLEAISFRIPESDQRVMVTAVR